MNMTLPFTVEINYFDRDKIWFHFANAPNSCFLDSSMAHATLGRYSYIVCDPFLLISAKHNIITCQEKQFTGNPFDFLQQHLVRYQAIHQPGLPPFQGGILGYFGYDLLHHLERIPFAAEDKINIPDLQVGFYDCLVAFDHQTKKAWIVSQGFPEVERSRRQERAKNRAMELARQIAALNLPAKPGIGAATATACTIVSNLSKQEYCALVARTVDYINQGDIFQANITQCFSAMLPSTVKARDLYAQLRQRNPAPFSALLNFNGVSIASSSPERYIKLQQNKVEARPIKGTAKRGLTPEQDQDFAQGLLQSEKDQAENTMIVDLIRNDLSRICSEDSVSVTQLCGLETYAAVHHLVSVIEGELAPNENAISLLKATFPAGSITGAPKIRAMEIIYELEPSARAAYCGSIGFIGFDGNMDMSIVIRTFIIKNSQVYFQAGCGIVADSIPELEYEESMLKARALMDSLQKVCNFDFND